MTAADTAVSVGTVALSIFGSWGIALQVGKRDRLNAAQSDAVDHLPPASLAFEGCCMLHLSVRWRRGKSGERWSVSRRCVCSTMRSFPSGFDQSGGWCERRSATTSGASRSRLSRRNARSVRSASRMRIGRTYPSRTWSTSYET
jgi:hypothetical protein